MTAQPDEILTTPPTYCRPCIDASNVEPTDRRQGEWRKPDPSPQVHYFPSGQLASACGMWSILWQRWDNGHQREEPCTNGGES